MTTTRSARLFNVPHIVSGTTLLFTAPAGFTAIVKTLALTNAGAQATQLIYEHVPADLSLAYQLRRVLPWPAASVDYWQTWFVLEATEQLYIVTDASSASAIGYGALLAA